jgi:eukaryotic-like serine/threonine-protein kinase
MLAEATAAYDRELELIWQEIQQRESLREALQLDDLLTRFPRHAPRLRQQIDMHRGLASPASQTQLEELPASGGAPSTHGADTAASRRRLPSIPGHELLGVLGQGTMGTVYLARQAGDNRLVAVKMLRGGALADSVALAHFRFEAETLGQLHHPNIVEIYGVGNHEGRAFYALEYVGGGDLRDRLDCVPQPARHSAELIQKLSLALDSVHRLGVVHRDLNPANILLTVDGEPKIADFGLAERVEPGPGHAQNGEIAGTPSYMAPEQTDPTMNKIGPATDLYALGAILYEMLTGLPPFQGRSFIDILHRIRTVPPTPPSRIEPSTPRDLEAICLKCLEKEPSRRYSSALALARDLEAFLADA